jgi:hypothetical protein
MYFDFTRSVYCVARTIGFPLCVLHNVMITGIGIIHGIVIYIKGCVLKGQQFR